jgi:hypothetical protein
MEAYLTGQIPDTAISNDSLRREAAMAFKMSYQQHIDIVVRTTYECNFKVWGTKQEPVLRIVCTGCCFE